MLAAIPSILKYLKPDDEAIEAMIDLFKDCSTPARAEELLKAIQCQEDEYKSDFRAADKKPFCSILYAASYAIRGNRPKAFEHLKVAQRGFNCSGQERNLAVARWMHGLLHLQDGHPEKAKLELEAAAATFATVAAQYRRISRYEEAELCQDLAEQITESTPKTSELRALQVKPRTQHSRGKTSKVAASQPVFAPLVFPIYDPVNAGKSGHFIFDSQPQGQASITELTIDEKPYRVFSLKAGEPVMLAPRVYRWMYVVGNSMNQARPQPLNEGDCLLVAETSASGLTPKPNDIVVAALTDPSGTGERAGVVKRYTAEGLCSESSQTYTPIPLKKARVKGIVLAVAKPI